MVHITPTKADYVIQHAPHCCNIWLVCNGNLIQTRWDWGLYFCMFWIIVKFIENFLCWLGRDGSNMQVQRTHPQAAFIALILLWYHMGVQEELNVLPSHMPCHHLKNNQYVNPTLVST